jgi:uncharacterized protein (TIRG00374 family)
VTAGRAAGRQGSSGVSADELTPPISPVDANIAIRPLAQASSRVRRPADLLRLIAALLVLAGAQLLTGVARAGVRKSERALLDSVVTLPPLLREVLTGAAQILLVFLPAVVVVTMAFRRRLALVGCLLLAGGLGLIVGVVDSHLLLGHSHPASWPALIAGRNGVFIVTFPPAAWLSGAAAVLTVGGAEMSRRWRSTLWWSTGTAAAIEVVVGAFLPVDGLVAAALGVTVGSLILLGFGEEVSRPTAAQVVAALRECGVALTSLTELPAGLEAPAAFEVTTAEGPTLAVRVYAADDRDRDRLARLYRWIMVRHPQNSRGGWTVEAAAEHELLAMVVGARSGARVSEPVVAYPVHGGASRSGALVAWTDVGGRRLDLLAPDEVSDAALADLWRSVGVLGDHRLAHRLLRRENIVIDGGDRAWLTGFVLAELGASDQLLTTDIAELLTSLALQVGPERAVATAVAALDARRVSDASAVLQPLALSWPTRIEVRTYDRARTAALSPPRARRGLRPGGRPDLLADLRTEVAQVTREPSAKLEPLSRFTRKRALGFVGAFAVLYLVLPQLANAGAAARALGNADYSWIIAALPAIFVAQSFSTLLLKGVLPAELPFGPTYVVEFAASFLNRVTPGNVGGMALNLRYLQKAGVDSGSATGSVGLQTLSGTTAILALAAISFAAAGRHSAVHPRVHGRQLLLLFIVGILVGGGLLVLTPRGRRFFHDKIWTFLRSAGATITEVFKSPGHVGLIVVGAIGGPLVQVAALSLCVHAMGGHLPVVQVAAVYLGGHVVASAAPVPGGLGALEAALIAGLSSLGMPAGAATSAVLIYRLLTYWLTIPIGWVALKIGEERGFV